MSPTYWTVSWSISPSLPSQIPSSHSPHLPRYFRISFPGSFWRLSGSHAVPSWWKSLGSPGSAGPRSPCTQSPGMTSAAWVSLPRRSGQLCNRLSCHQWSGVWFWSGCPSPCSWWNPRTCDPLLPQYLPKQAVRRSGAPDGSLLKSSKERFSFTPRFTGVKGFIRTDPTFLPLKDLVEWILVDTSYLPRSAEPESLCRGFSASNPCTLA